MSVPVGGKKGFNCLPFYGLGRDADLSVVVVVVRGLEVSTNHVISKRPHLQVIPPQTWRTGGTLLLERGWICNTVFSESIILFPCSVWHDFPNLLQAMSSPHSLKRSADARQSSVSPPPSKRKVESTTTSKINFCHSRTYPPLLK